MGDVVTLRLLALPLLVGLGALAPSEGRVADPLFGDITGRPSRDGVAMSEKESRQQEARELRRLYWQRERERVAIASPSSAVPVAGRALATR